MKTFLTYFTFLFLILTSCQERKNNKQLEDTNKTQDERISEAESDFHRGSGVVVYDKYEPLKNKPIDIHYYIPERGDIKKMPILFVMHGNGRNAAGYLKSWVNLANEKQFMVFVPEFKKELYSSAEYHRGGVVLGNEQQEEKTWTYSVIDPIFQYIKKQTNSEKVKFDLFGHSAGSQFVHRMLLFKPNTNVSRAVAANAGWYLIPDVNDDYPHGLKNSPVNSANLDAYFKKNLLILIGTADIDPDSKDLNKTSKDMEQGMNRYERAYYFYKKSDSISKSHNIPFHWKIKEVVGVAHSNAGMAQAAAEYLYD